MKDINNQFKKLNMIPKNNLKSNFEYSFNKKIKMIKIIKIK